MNKVLLSLFSMMFLTVSVAQTDNFVLVDHDDFEYQVPVSYVVPMSLNDWNEYPQNDQCVPEGQRALLCNFRNDYTGLALNKEIEICPGSDYYFTWQMGNCYLAENNNGSFIKPHVRVVVEDALGTILFQDDWANLTNWQTYQTTVFNPATSSIFFKLYTEIPGASFGNDLVFDDLRLYQNNPTYSYIDDNGSEIALCTDDAAVDLADYFVQPSVSGVWNGPSVLTNGVEGTFDPAVNLSGDYTYTTQGAPLCPDTTSVFQVVVGVTPQLDPVSNVDICGGYELEVIQGTDLSGNEAYYTQSGGGGTQYMAGDVITSDVTLFVYDEDQNSSVCNAEISFSITVHDAPDAGDDFADLICLPSATTTLTLSDNMGVHDNNGAWEEVSANASGSFNATTSELGLSGIGEGVYEFIYVVPAIGGCEADTSYHTITILETPQPQISSSDTNICFPDVITFDPGTQENDGFIYDWAFGNGTVASDENPVVSFTAEGCYTVDLTVTNNGFCSVSVQEPNFICAYPTPIADFSMDQDSLDAASPILTGENLSVGADGFLWTFGDGGTSTDTDLNYSFEGAEGGYYSVSLVAYTDQGCADTMTQSIFMFNQFVLTIPNVFTPNNDGANDLFTVYVEGTKSLEWTVFDRWGLVMARGKQNMEPNAQYIQVWDGTVDGMEATEGVYFFRVNYENYFDETGVEHGNISLFRK